MARQSQVQFSIPEPCNIPWKGMIPVDTDQRHCSSCDKVVTDFSRMSDDELLLYFRHNNGKICGRLSQTQLNRPMTLLPEKTVHAKWWRTLILIPLTLFGKQAKAQFVEITQTQIPDTTVLAQQNDSLKNDSLAKEKITVNVSLQSQNDSLNFRIADLHDSTYQYVWKPGKQVYVDSLYPYVIDDPILITGGCVAITDWKGITSPVIVAIEEGPFPAYGDILTSEICSSDAPQSILTIFLDTIVPFRKKKNRNRPVAGNSEKVEMKDPLKEVSNKPHEKPKPQQPALPASNEIAIMMPAERKKWWRS